MTGTPFWRLTLFGKPQLVSPDGRVMRCEGKTLALLAYLALEGPTPRARLTGLLWPDTEETPARNNLVHLLRRTHRAYGEELVQGQEVLTLSPAVRCDVSLSPDEPDTTVSPVSMSTLLDGVDYDDLPDLADWLLAEREHFEASRLQAFGQQIQRLEEAGEIAAATLLAGRLVEADPLSEDGWRRLMRLHYQAGDRPAALKAYRRCKDILRRELGVEPSAASRDLARAIDLGTVDVAPARARLPLAVLRPPRLIGRDDAWALMEEAWAAGRQIFITGDPGSGKTRLAQDFLRGKGTWLYLPGRPGDQDVPFASAARNARARLAAAPHVALPGWVRRELSRLLPELHEGQDLPPLTAESDRHTFFLAHLEMARLTAPGFVATLNDDVQYYDPATTELGAFMFSHALSQEGQGNFPRFISVYRRGELRPAQQATVERMISAGLAVRVELAPLDRAAIGTLLGDLQLPPPRSGELPAQDALVERLYHATGGNPQFVLETVRHIVETGEPGLLSGPSGLARGFEELLRGRLTRLSESALHTARAAAVLRVDFTPEQIAEVLGMSLLDTAGAWEELDAAQILAGEGFSHDLVAEAVLSGTPEPVRKVLHRASARTLAGHGAPPTRIARHWLEGGDVRQAAPWLLAAARLAGSQGRPAEAADFYAQAAHAFETTGQDEQARAAREEQAQLAGPEQPPR